jgi:CubicO group peptidase (beta-lactamase class C family)
MDSLCLCRFCLVLTLAVVAGMARSAGQIQESRLAGQVDGIFASWNRTDSPGGVVGILEQWEVVLVRAYGMASLEYDVPIRLDTLFNAGSVAKQFTALAMLRLAGQGRLRLDEEIRQYVPEVPVFGTPISLRQLIHHTSGLRDFQSLLAMAGWRTEDSITGSDALAYVRRQRELNFPPGEKFLYGNTGYWLMGKVLERVTGQPFVDWMREQIFQPLGMLHSGFREDTQRIYKDTATSYYGPGDDGFRRAKEWWGYVGNGNLYTNLDDLLQWLRAWRAPHPAQAAEIPALFERGALSNGEPIDYAFGLVIDHYQGLRIVHHGGAIGGYAAFIGFFPDRDLGIVILSNFSGADPRGKALAVADLWFAGESPAASADPSIPERREPPVVAIDPELLDAYIGEYRLDARPDLILSFTREQDHLFLQLPGRTRSEVFPAAAAIFFLRGGQSQIEFHRDASGRVSRLTLREGRDYVGRRIERPPWTPEQIAELTGSYYSSELDTTYTLVAQAGALVVRHPRHPDFELKPTPQGPLEGAWFFHEVAPERDDQGRVIGLRVSNPRVRNLFLAKTW